MTSGGCVSYFIFLFKNIHCQNSTGWPQTNQKTIHQALRHMSENIQLRWIWCYYRATHLENIWAIFTWQHPLKDYLPAAGHFYVLIEITTWNWNCYSMSFCFCFRSHTALTCLLQNKMDLLVFIQFIFWSCTMVNILWLGIETLIQIVNMFHGSWLYNIYDLIQYTSNNRIWEIKLGLKNGHQWKQK